MSVEYDAQDIEALLREHPRLIAPVKATGPSLTMRPATPDDAEFILSLRLDPEKNAHLSPVKDDVEAQRQWIANDPDIYLIIETDRPVGTVRLYNQLGTSFEWGSWIMRGHPKGSAREAMHMVYQAGLGLGFTASHFSVRRENAGVWKMHERFGAERVDETAEDYLYRINKGRILDKLGDIPISVEW